MQCVRVLGKPNTEPTRGRGGVFLCPFEEAIVFRKTHYFVDANIPRKNLN